jgi:hypothetical protein
MKEKKQNVILSAIKRMIFPVILVAIIVGVSIYIINFKTPADEDAVVEPYAYTGEEETVTIENDNLRLVMDAATTQFSLEVKDSGKIWYSNPVGAADDAMAQVEEKAKLQSPLLMSYAVVTGLETTYNTFAYSTSNGIYEIVKEGDNSIRVNYSLGNIEKEYAIPPVIVEADFDALRGAMEQKDADFVKDYYKKYDINKPGKKDNVDELKEKYPIYEQSVIYVLRDGTKENVKKKLLGIFETAGYTYEDYLRDKELDQAEKSNDKPVFNVSVVYTLDGDDLVVEVPLQDLQFRKDTPIYTVTPLPYFGAGSAQDEGYMLVPEGGGALINFNNGKVSQNSYYTNVYGWDMCITRKAVVHNTRAYYGVYGVAEQDDSFICMLEDGSSYASIQADVAGKVHSYNFVNAIYSICQREQYDVGDIANSAIFEYATDLPDETLTQRYKFVNSGSYVDMAKTYGEYLQKEYAGYLDLVSDTSTPVAIEIVGAIDKVKQIVGVPVSRPLKLTSYNEASAILDELTAAGFTNMHVKLSGWCNGGVNQKVLSKAKTIGALGSKKDLQNLITKAAANGNTVYLNGITQYAFNSNILDGFFSYRDAAKFISKERAELYEYSNVTYGQRENADHSYFLLHTDLAKKYADNLVNAANKYSAGASFQDLGSDLSSDFYRKKTNSREAVLKTQVDQLKNYNNNGTPLMINMGNDYAVPFCQMVTGMDLRGSEYTIIDECIPFYQLAVHGRVDYTGRAINTNGNMENELLYAAEYGAGLCFEVMEESSFATQKTLYTEYYGAYFDAVKDNITEIYTRYNKELGHTFNQEMVGHENLSSDVSCTEYADGTKVYVNYGYSDFTEGGVKVPARDYVVTR